MRQLHPLRKVVLILYGQIRKNSGFGAQASELVTPEIWSGAQEFPFNKFAGVSDVGNVAHTLMHTAQPQCSTSWR